MPPVGSLTGRGARRPPRRSIGVVTLWANLPARRKAELNRRAASHSEKQPLSINEKPINSLSPTRSGNL
jgi:hypothetical protein